MTVPKKKASPRKKKSTKTVQKTLFTLQEKLAWHNYCLNCGFTGLNSAFIVKGPQDAMGGEILCPNMVDGKDCLGDDIVNAASVTLCSQCGKSPALETGSWCGGCLDKDEEARAALNEVLALEESLE